MCEIIPVAFKARWSEPVNIVQKHELKIIDGPAGALRHMRDSFPDKSGPTYWRAVHVCFAALRREADADIARSLFMDAYEDHLMRLEAH